MSIQFNQTGEPTLVKHADGGVTVAIPIAVKRNRVRREVLLPPVVATTTLPEPQELTALQATWRASSSGCACWKTATQGPFGRLRERKASTTAMSRGF